MSIRAEAPRLAALALEVLRRDYPHKLDHLILDEGDRPRPADIHPVFHGCYDWHSSVHMHWSLLRLRRMPGEGDARTEIDRHFDARFTRERVDRERAYASEDARGAFERPYGWAWLLALHAELDVQSTRWAAALAPFAQEVATRLAEFLPRGPYPVRAGMHANSAFAMILARRYALRMSDARLLDAIDATARRWFANDRDYPAAYEPGGADFLSGGLCEALLMSRVLGDAFRAWWSSFDRDGAALRHWTTPAIVADTSDPQLVHLAGLNLSRAWCLRELAPSVAPEERSALLAAADAHWAAGWPHVTGGDFVATHWLLTFALLAEDSATAATS